MLLQRLNALGLRLEERDREDGTSLPPGFRRQALRWLIQLDGEHVHALKVEKEEALPYLKRSSGGAKPQLLADKGEFVFGIPADGSEKKKKRAELRRRGFFALVHACSRVVNDPALEAVMRFLQRSDLPRFAASQNIMADELITFRVGDTLITAQPKVRTFWADVVPRLGTLELETLTAEHVLALMSPDRSEELEPLTECLICEQVRVPERIHPVALKLPASVSKKVCALVTADKDNTAFHSYGLQQCLVAPICRPCAERYGRTINRLIEGHETHLTVGRSVYLFWTKDGTWVPTSILANPEPGEIRALLASALGGDRAALRVEDCSFEEAFYATAFSASGARVVVRDWLETTVPRAKANLARYFRLQQLVGEWGEVDAPFLPLQVYQVDDPKPHWRDGLAESVAPPRQSRRDVNKLSPTVPQALLRLALHGGQLPEGLLFQAVQRNRAE
jgi:CRISPR-associated protein Csd1